MARSRSLAVCGLLAVAAPLADASEDAEEVIGALYMGKSRADPPFWASIHRKRSAPQPVRTATVRFLCQQ